MTITTPENIYSRYTGDDYALPPSEKLQVLIEDAEDILFDTVEGLEDRADDNEQVSRRINRVVSNAVIRYCNTAAEGISSHQMTIGGASEMVSYSSGRNRNTIFYTEEEINSLRDKDKKPRGAFMDMYGDGGRAHRIVYYDSNGVGYYTDKGDYSNINGFYS